MVKDVITRLTADEQYREALETVTSQRFSGASAKGKREILWQFVSRFPYDTLPPANTTVLQLMFRLIRRAWLKEAFEVAEDLRPPRTKAFHPQGTVALVRFVADGAHPFTGVYSSGAVGLARLSLAMGERNYGPSCAFKFLIDGDHASENLLVDQSLDTQTSRDFFERAPTNYTLWPTAYPLKRVFPLVHWWLSAIADPMFQPLDHLATVTADGSVVRDVVAPRLVYLYAADERHTDPRSRTDFRELLSEIPSESELYHLHGTVSEGGTPVYIGRIVTESGFVASEFGDRILSLRHTPSSAEGARPR